MEFFMIENLEQFKDCDTFSLKVARPIISIPKKDKEKLLSDYLKTEKEFLLNEYNNCLEDKGNLPKFETLYSDIFMECQQFYTRFNGNDFLFDFIEGYSPFIAEHIKFDTKYYEPKKLIKSFYQSMQVYFINRLELEELKENDFFLENDFNDENLKVLKQNFLKYEFIYDTKFNEETKSWLKEFFNNFAFKNKIFEDLTIYKNNEIQFLSLMQKT